MKATDPEESSDPNDLSRKLQSWRVDVAIPESFRREVWERIAERQAARGSTFWRRVLAWIEHASSQPAVACAIVLVSAMGGMMVGREKAEVATVEEWRVLEERYARSVNPAGRHVDYVNHLPYSVE